MGAALPRTVRKGVGDVRGAATPVRFDSPHRVDSVAPLGVYRNIDAVSVRMFLE